MFLFCERTFRYISVQLPRKKKCSLEPMWIIYFSGNGRYVPWLYFTTRNRKNSLRGSINKLWNIDDGERLLNFKRYLYEKEKNEKTNPMQSKASPRMVTKLECIASCDLELRPLALIMKSVFFSLWRIHQQHLMIIQRNVRFLECPTCFLIASSITLDPEFFQSILVI